MTRFFKYKTDTLLYQKSKLYEQPCLNCTTGAFRTGQHLSILSTTTPRMPPPSGKHFKSKLNFQKNNFAPWLQTGASLVMHAAC